MKRICLIALVILIATSCTKEKSFQKNGTNGTGGNGSGNNGTSGNCLLTRMVQGTSPTDDTVLLVRYDSLSRITSVLDSVDGYTLAAVYTGSALGLSKRTYLGSDDVNYTYNSAGKPVSAISVGAGNKVIAEYTSDTILSKVTQYVYNGSGYDFWRYYTFTYDSRNDVSAIKEFIANGTQTGEADFTYTDLPNSLAIFNLMNFENYLGMEDVIPTDMFLYSSHHLVKSYTVGSSTTSNTYTLDNSQHVISSVSTYKDGSNVLGIYTRYYFYTCK